MPRVSDVESSSSSSSDSDSDSDSSSVHSIPAVVNPPRALVQPPVTSTSNQAEYATDIFVSSGNHVSGRLVDNRAKRKTEDGDDGIDGHTSKTRRLRSHNQFSLQFNGDEPQDSDYEDGAEDEESETDLDSAVESDAELVGSDVRHSQAQTQPTMAPLHPAFPRSQWPNPIHREGVFDY